MTIWIFIAMIVMVKVPIAAMMLWMPLRHDSAVSMAGDSSESDAEDEDGGDDGPPGGIRPRAPRPRRGPHMDLPPPPPPRMRAPGRRAGRRLPVRLRAG